jgi:diguanylate cyclase (GGDEF)-like protein
MLDAMPVTGFAFDMNGAVIYLAGAGAALPEEDVIGRPVTDVWPGVQDHLAAALAGRTTRFDFEYQNRIFDITYLPLILEGQQQAGVVGLSWNVTDQRRQTSLVRRRAEALLTLSDRENAAGMEIDAVLESIAQTAAEQLGTWAYTTLLSADNRSFEVAGGWHPDARIRDAIRTVYGRGVPADTPAFAAVLQTARALRVDPANQNITAMQALVLPELREFMRSWPAIGIAHAPLMSRGRVIGVLSVHRSTGHPGGAFTDDDIALLDDFGQRAGLHVQVLMMFRRRVEAELRAVQQAKRQSALADLAGIAMGPASLHDVVESAADTISANLGNIPVTVVALDPERGPTPRADRGSAPVQAAVADESTDGPETPEPLPELRRQIEGVDGPWGVLTVQGEPVRDADVVAFVETACSLLGTAVLQRMTTAQLQYQALHDALTSLPNRALLQDRLQGALGRCGPGDEVVLLMMDLDRFKTVNDSAGHVVGDHLLQEVARRLRATFPEHTVGRLGGDEFALVAEIRDDPNGAHRLASTVADAFREPFTLPGGHELFVSAAIGMSVARHVDTGRLGPGSGSDASGGDLKDVTGMLREADAAMYSAKRGGGYRLFDERLRRAAHEKLDTETALRRAVAAADFTLVYQPVVRAADNRPVGVEALLRWQRDGRIVLPGEFIPAAEETGLIVEIGRWVLRQAITDMASWQHGGDFPCETLSVNASMSELQSETYADEVLDLLEDAGLNPRRLVIEVTESMLADNLLISHRNLRRLRNAGVHVAIDDFGTGYSSLGQLTELPVDVLKIDRTFVNRMETSGNRAIVTAVVTLGQALGLTITAEGVERADQAEQLAELGCDLLQGFHFGAGISATQIAAMTFSPFSHRVPLD